jgi:signal peptidase
MRRLIGGLATTAVWMFVVACVGLLLAVGLGPRTGRYRTLTVLSGSMRPGIQPGDVIVVTPERPSQLRVGQAITYQIPVEDHRVVTHRVIEILERGDAPVFRTQGDANNAPDPWLARLDGDTVWRERFAVPGLGHALHWLRLPIARTATVVVLPLFVALWWVIGIWRDDREVVLDGERPDQFNRVDDDSAAPGADGESGEPPRSGRSDRGTKTHVAIR